MFVADLFALLAEHELVMALLVSLALSLIVVGGVARASGRSWVVWFVVSLLISPLLAGLLLLTLIIVRGRGHHIPANTRAALVADLYGSSTAYKNT